MLTQFTEYDLLRAPPSGGIYAFHLRLIRNARVGLAGDNGPAHLHQVKIRLKTLVNRVASFEALGSHTGTLREVDKYGHHGRELNLKGHFVDTNYLTDLVEALDTDDVPSFVRCVDALSSFFPPLYVGIAVKQSLQARYSQHKRDFETGSSDSTFGGRLATAKLEWTDLSYSCVPQHVLRLSDRSIRALENYVHFLCRPRLGKS
jgi:hypothetical protein